MTSAKEASLDAVKDEIQRNGKVLVVPIDGIYSPVY
jgi:hypothetical protein